MTPAARITALGPLLHERPADTPRSRDSFTMRGHYGRRTARTPPLLRLVQRIAGNPYPAPPHRNGPRPTPVASSPFSVPRASNTRMGRCRVVAVPGSFRGLEDGPSISTWTWCWSTDPAEIQWRSGLGNSERPVIRSSVARQNQRHADPSRPVYPRRLRAFRSGLVRTASQALALARIFHNATVSTGR